MTELLNRSARTLHTVEADVRDAPATPIGGDPAKQMLPQRVSMTYVSYDGRPWFFSHGQISGLLITKSGEVGRRHVGRKVYGHGSMPDWFAKHVDSNTPTQPKEWK